MSGVLIESGEAAIVALVERVSPDLAKMLGAALGSGVGAGAYKYLQPHFAGRGFDNSKSSARKSGVSVGRSIAGGNVTRVSKKIFKETTFDTGGLYKKYSPNRRRNSKRGRRHLPNCGCCSSRKY